ncbi:MAG: thermonuclease family protein [Nitrospira sp.]|jgi:endonuclease YncB( thermonuclease family)|nr:thermonuclease family protein [Nitrospira sp. BO4]
MAALTLRFLIVTLLLLFSDAKAYPFTGEVVRVVNGDVIEILHNGKSQPVRLYGIDCPAEGQPYGSSAKEVISIMSYALNVTLQIHGKDRYGRILADVVLADGTNLNHVLVKEGWCWWDRPHAPESAILEALEAEARDASRGLWIDPSPVSPWAWRKLAK